MDIILVFIIIVLALAIIPQIYKLGNDNSLFFLPKVV